ncbi:MAG: hypothetical protein AB7V50_05275 [Vampirovibrionia bacterium]
MFNTDLKKQILAAMAIAILVCSSAFVIPQSGNANIPAIEATGVLG